MDVDWGMRRRDTRSRCRAGIGVAALDIVYAAVDFAVHDADGCRHDEPDLRRPHSRAFSGSWFDYTWLDDLQDILFQETDYLGLLDPPAAAVGRGNRGIGPGVRQRPRP